jgi:hypothetical protein
VREGAEWTGNIAELHGSDPNSKEDPFSPSMILLKSGVKNKIIVAFVDFTSGTMKSLSEKRRCMFR